MTPDAMLAELVQEQVADDASRWAAGHRREVQASSLESAELPDLFDLMADPRQDVVGEAIAREKLAGWEASSGGEWMPDRPRETVGLGLVGWHLGVEAATLIGRVCPCCGGRPAPGTVCLACTKAGGRLDDFLERLRRLDGQLPPEWRAMETQPERAAVLDEHDRQEQSLAERRWAGRAARRAALGPPKGRQDRTPAYPRKVRMVDANGQGRMVRPSLVEAYQASGWKVVA